MPGWVLITCNLGAGPGASLVAGGDGGLLLVLVVLVVVVPIGQVREVNYMPSVQQLPRGCSGRRFIEMHQGIVQAPCLVHRSH